MKRPVTSRHVCHAARAGALLILLSSLTSSLAGEFDWYRWRGPSLNGISAEKGWRTDWPAEGPKRLWKAAVGTGFSSVSVAQGRVFTLGNLKNEETVYCLDAETGKQVWKHTYECSLDPKYYEGGPSSTPTLDGSAVYTFSRKGHLFCLDAATGQVKWQANLAKDLGLAIPEWGFASSPLIEGDLLILNAGAAGTAVHKATGKVVWTSAKEGAGYSSAVPFNLGARRCVALFVAKHAVVVELKDGKELWRHPWRTSYDVNAADPIIVGDEMFIASGYNHGCALLQIAEEKATVVWENKNMRNMFNSSVLLDGHIYGVDGDMDKGYLRCLEWKTGNSKWTFKDKPASALVAADGKLLVQGVKGELFLGAASPDGFKPMAQAQVLGGKCWTTAVLANGRIYCRNAAGDLVCLDVRGGSGS